MDNPILEQSPREAGSPGKVVYPVAFIGALLIGAGAVSFFAANTKAIPGWFKLLLLFVAIMASYTAGFWLRFERRSLPGVGNALIFLGALLFGAALFLIAQGFHVRTDEPTLVYLWAIGLLPLAYLLAASSLATIALIACAIGLGWELEQWDAISKMPAQSILALYMAFGLLLYSLGQLHRDNKRLMSLNAPYTALGLFMTLFTLYALSFRYAWDWGGSGTARESLSLASPFGQRLTIMVALAAIAIIVHVVRNYHTGRMAMLLEAGLILLLLSVAGALAYWSPSLTNTDPQHYPPLALAFNLLLFVSAVGAIALGYHQQNSILVNLGFWFFGIHLLTRYFDVFWGLLPNSLIFSGAGLMLFIAAALLERTRRQGANSSAESAPQQPGAVQEPARVIHRLEHTQEAP